MRWLDPILRVTKLQRNFFEIILWWEIRRILYNFLFITALLVGFLVIGQLVHLEPSEDIIEPLALFFLFFIFNGAYTLGWLIELCIPRSQSFAPKLLKIGLYITLFLSFLPMIIHLIMWAGRGFTKMM